MPKRVLDFDALWSSDKLAACAPWAQAEYAWLYGLADCNGSFELTNLRVIWGRVAAIRHALTLQRLEQVFAEFRSEEHTSELQSQSNLVCRLLLEKKKKQKIHLHPRNNR